MGECLNRSKDDSSALVVPDSHALLEEAFSQRLLSMIEFAAHDNPEILGFLENDHTTEEWNRFIDEIIVYFNQQNHRTVVSRPVEQSSSASDDVKVWQPNYDSTGFSSDKEQSNVYNSFFCFIEWLNQGFAEIGGVIDNAINFAWELLDYSDLLGVESHSVELPHS